MGATEQPLTVVCAWCGRVRESDGTWLLSKTLEQLHEIAAGRATHGVCPECYRLANEALTEQAQTMGRAAQSPPVVPPHYLEKAAWPVKSE